jgi:hypothetical protein
MLGHAGAAENIQAIASVDRNYDSTVIFFQEKEGMNFISEQELKLLISDDDTKKALERIIDFSKDLSGFKGRALKHGYMHGFGLLLDGQPAEERPFDFAVNKNSIKCYIRKPGLRRIGVVGRNRVKTEFPEADMLNGELRVDLTSVGEADRLLKCLFPQKED